MPCAYIMQSDKSLALPEQSYDN